MTLLAFTCGLCLVTFGNAQALKIRVIVGSTLLERNNVIELEIGRNGKAYGACPTLTLEHATSQGLKAPASELAFGILATHPRFMDSTLKPAAAGIRARPRRRVRH